MEEKREAKSTFRIMQEIFKNEGVMPLYRGLLPVLSSLYCSNFVYFYTFHGLKKLVHSGGANHRPSADLILGYFSGDCQILLFSNIPNAMVLWKVVNVDAKSKNIYA